MKLPRTVLEWLIYGGGADRRYTQDSPVLPDVWIAYGRHPNERLELLLTPHWDASAGQIAVVLRKSLGLGEPGDEIDDPIHRIAYTSSSVAVALTLEELVDHVFPMTSWWKKRFFKAQKSILEEVGTRTGRTAEEIAELLTERLRELDKLPDETARKVRKTVAEAEKYRVWVKKPGQKPRVEQVPLDLQWMMRIVGWLAWARSVSREVPDPDPGPEGLERWRREHGPDPEEVIAALFEMVDSRLPEPLDDETALVFQVNRNRSAEMAIAGSRQAVKADAAERLFEIDCSELNWAVIDSGIDATHPAFRRRDKKTGKPYEHPFGSEDKPKNRTRVMATYDFSRVRDLLNPSNLRPGKLPKGLADLEPLLAGDGEKAGELRAQLDDLRKRLQFGREVDWQMLEVFLEVPHRYGEGGYWYPTSGHGTHVAGILAADWKAEGEDQLEEDLRGVCPNLNLYDFRVLPRGVGGPDDEFNVIAALQFIRHLNVQKNYRVIHGVNLSLSIPHEVANFACGRTPVCDECERVASSGVVVVAAAGNNGYLRYQTAQGEKEGYHTLSVTDPGNAEGVITVGATHRSFPHTYGVSYFSSRGPTGDGRIKPDLVAPGEKITAPVPDAGKSEKDGTSMAAPHVSGAAAMLMARYNELIGQPERIKQVLCDTATDLGRERYFQGHGMLDILRALQAV